MSTPYGISGRGWDFPPAFRKSTGTADMLTSGDDINSSLDILLRTAAGERVMQSKYGCDLKELLFEPLTTTFKTFITEKIRSAILFYEPRIVVKNISLNEEGTVEGRIVITIEYLERTTNTRYNYVFDYYINEGTEITNKTLHGKT